MYVYYQIILIQSNLLFCFGYCSVNFSFICVKESNFQKKQNYKQNTDTHTNKTTFVHCNICMELSKNITSSWFSTESTEILNFTHVKFVVVIYILLYKVN